MDVFLDFLSVFLYITLYRAGFQAEWIVFSLLRESLTTELHLEGCVLICIDVILSANFMPQKTHCGLLDIFMLSNFDVGLIYSYSVCKLCC